MAEELAAEPVAVAEELAAEPEEAAEGERAAARPVVAVAAWGEATAAEAVRAAAARVPSSRSKTSAQRGWSSINEAIAA